jgi:hypothetical protein
VTALLSVEVEFKDPVTVEDPITVEFPPLGTTVDVGTPMLLRVSLMTLVSVLEKTEEELAQEFEGAPYVTHGTVVELLSAGGDSEGAEPELDELLTAGETGTELKPDQLLAGEETTSEVETSLGKTVGRV